MRLELQSQFSSTKIESYSDKLLYLADYSKETSSKRGVEFTNQLPEINSLRIENIIPITISGAIFDDRNFTDSVNPRISVKHCEAMIFPEVYSASNWIAFVELKYTSGKRNMPKDRTTAKTQVDNTVQVLRDRCIIPMNKRVYGIIHFPETEMLASYGFEFTSDELKEYSIKRIKMLYASKIVVNSNLELTVNG